MAISVSFINMKGGVGKTTLSAQVAHAADRAGYKTLVVDLDPQSNLSQSLLTPKKYVRHLKDRKPTVVQLFDRYMPPSDEYESPRQVDIHDIIIKKAGYWHNSTLDLLPSRLELSHSLKNPTGKERRLAKALTKVADEYDLIIIDCAPTESILTEAAYFASRYVLVPVKPEFMATIGLPLLARSIEEFNMENEDHKLDICGIVFNHSSSYSSGPEGRQSIKDVKAEAKKRNWHTFDTHVHYSASYPKSAREGTPISNTSYVRWEVTHEFSNFSSEFFRAIGLVKEE
jgi:chromosome partitioning protein